MNSAVTQTCYYQFNMCQRTSVYEVTQLVSWEEGSMSKLFAMQAQKSLFRLLASIYDPNYCDGAYNASMIQMWRWTTATHVKPKPG